MFLIFSFNTGGIERLLIDMCNNMSDKGNTVSLCIINEDYDNDLLKNIDDKVKIIKLNRKIGAKAYFSYMHEFANVVKREHIDVLHCQGINCVLFSYLAKIISPKLIILNTVHDVGNYSSYSAFKIFVQNLILDETIAISNVVESEILKRQNKRHRVTTIYNAIDISKFKVSDKNIDLTHIVIGNVARFFPQKKGQDVLISAVKKLKDTTDYNIICRFAGDVFKGQQTQFEDTQKYIKDNGLEECISFMGNVDDIPGFLNDIDVFVLPSRFEGFGIAMIEALAMGIPVVASDIDGPKEIFELAQKEDVYLGALAHCDDPNDFADNIIMCIQNYQDIDRNKIRDFVEKHFSIDNMVAEHLKLYESFIYY